MDHKRRRRRAGSVPRVVVWLGGILMLLAVADCVRCLPQLFEARQHADRLRRDLGELGRTSAQLRRDVRRLREDPRAVEEIARRDLGLMRPGEIVFIIVDTPATSTDRRP